MKLLSCPTHVLALALCVAACQGSVASEGDIDDSPGKPGKGGSRGDGGSGGPSVDNPMIEIPQACDKETIVAPGKWRRLTRAQYAASVKDLLGITPDVSGFNEDTGIGHFATNSKFAPQTDDIGIYASVAEAVAKQATSNVAALTKCGSQSETACADKFIKDLATRAFRRPVTTEETAALTAAYQVGREESFSMGIGLVIEAVLQSASFVYLTEFGGTPKNGLAKLTGYEVAARLSYMFTNSLPSADLFAAAQSGALDTAEGVRDYASKLLDDKAFLARTMKDFHSQMLHIAKVGDQANVAKDSLRFPEFDPELRQAMIEDSHQFISHVFTEGDGTVATLLTAPYAFPKGPLLKLYGIEANQLDASGRFEFKDGTRVGLLTNPSVMTAIPPIVSKFAATYRGNMVRGQILCQELPDPPDGAADFAPPPGADKLTQQQLLRVHQDDPTCSGCHRLIDNIGFGFENYDAVGRYKTKAADGSDIDSSGSIVESDIDGEFRGPKELAEKLAGSGNVRTCLSKQWFTYTLGREPELDESKPHDLCSIGAVAASLTQGRGDVRTALLTLVASDAFRYRQGENQ